VRFLSWLKSDESGISNILPKTIVVAFASIIISLSDGIHYLSEMPDVILSDSRSESANVEKDLGLLSDGMNVILNVLAIA